MTDPTTPTAAPTLPAWINPEPLEGLRVKCEVIREAADAMRPQIERLMRHAHDAECAASDASHGVPRGAADGAHELVSAMVGDREMRDAVKGMTSDMFDLFEAPDWPAGSSTNGAPVAPIAPDDAHEDESAPPEHTIDEISELVGVDVLDRFAWSSERLGWLLHIVLDVLEPVQEARESFDKAMREKLDVESGEPEYEQVRERAGLNSLMGSLDHYINMFKVARGV